MRRNVITKGIGVELLLLCVERSQLRWFRHLVRMPPSRFPMEVFQACPAGRRPWGRPRSRWRDYISALAWEHLRILQSELVDVSREREVRGPLMKLLPLDQAVDDGWEIPTLKNALKQAYSIGGPRAE